ncbi:MAG: TIGR01212 family radical SAM protein [Eubacterium sp.]|nr:TIGR01212 family radical SAM protein [Eubacterium sp.]
MNAFDFSDSNKRYHTLDYYNRHFYGEKVYKAAIDAGCTCPNRDGTKGKGGCIFCSGGSGYFTARPDNADLHGSVTRQLTAERDRIYRKHPDSGLIAYFQAGSNTYADAADIEEMLSAAADFGVKGISTATRADCLDKEKIALLRDYNKKLPLTVELGLQTAHDSTARQINRCHGYADFLRGYDVLKAAGIRVCVHIIDGLPGETRADMLATAETLGRLCPDAVKIHLLHVISGTPLAQMYEDGGYTPLTKEEYIDIVVSQLEYLPPQCVIERLTGDGDKRTLLAPLWSRDKISVLGGIDKLMSERDTYQGRLYKQKGEKYESSCV